MGGGSKQCACRGDTDKKEEADSPLKTLLWGETTATWEVFTKTKSGVMAERKHFPIKYLGCTLSPEATEGYTPLKYRCKVENGFQERREAKGFPGPGREGKSQDESYAADVTVKWSTLEWEGRGCGRAVSSKDWSWSTAQTGLSQRKIILWALFQRHQKVVKDVDISSKA